MLAFIFVAASAEIAHARLLVIRGPFGPLLHDRVGFGPSKARGVGAGAERGVAALSPPGDRVARDVPPKASAKSDSAPSASDDGMGLAPIALASLFGDGGSSPRPSVYNAADTGKRGGGGCVMGAGVKHGKGACSMQDAGDDFRSLEASPIRRNGKPAAGTCGNISKRVCIGAADMERQTEKKGNALVKEFLRERRLSLGEYSNAMSGYARDPQRYGAVYGAFQEFLQSRIPDIDSVAKNAIGDVTMALASMPFRPERSAAMGDRARELTAHTGPVSGDRESGRIYATGCKNGLAVGAFLVPSRNELYVCPGMVLRAMATGRPLRDSLLFVLAHECTHRCGADVDPRTSVPSEFRQDWMPTGMCLQRRFGGNLVNDRSLGEISADVTAVKTLGKRVVGLSPDEAFDVVSSAVSPLCGRAGDDVHPLGDDRLKLLKESPEIMGSLGCKVERDSCT